MGRMADARKRARQAGGATTAPAVPEPAAPEPAAPEPVAVSADDEVPASPPEAPAGALALPASGLAEDILGQLEGRSAPAPAPVEAAPAGGEMPGSHSLSFFAAPVHEERAAAEATEHLATFFLDREEYGVDVRQVQEIRRVSEITSVPRAPEFIRGVINLRGRILPVLDLKRKLGLGEVAPQRTTRIVVVRVKERLLGLLVDGASQVLKIAVSQVEPPPEEVVEKGGDYIRGVAKLEDRLIILVDLGRLLAHELRAAGAPAGGGAPEFGLDGVS